MKANRIKVAFYCDSPPVWPSFQELYSMLNADERFEATVIAAYNVQEETPEDSPMVAFCEQNNIPYINVMKDGTPIPIEEHHFDYIFPCRPYDGMRHKQFYSEELKKISTVCHILYGVNLFRGRVEDITCNFKHLRHYDYVFAESQDHVEMYYRRKQDYSEAETKIVKVGSTKYDLVGKSVSKIEETLEYEYSQVCLYTPRWTTMDDNCTFLDYCEDVLNYAINNPDILVIFRPHPRMEGFFRSNIWINGEWEEFIDRCKEIKNIELDFNAEYYTSFAKATVMISDASSLLAEFLLTGKPLIYTYKTDTFNTFGEKLKDGYYVCETWEDVLSTLEMLKQGEDPKKQERQKIINEVFYFPEKGAAHEIRNTLLSDYEEKRAKESEAKPVTKVITYGTYDVFHVGHYNLLKNAKALGDYLIVGVTTTGYDESRGKLNVKDSLITRIENVRKTGLADLIIVEEYEGQKIRDIQKYGADIFTVGSDWVGKFDYLNEYCKVVYLPRTQGISSTQIRSEHSNIIRMGIVGCGRIAGRTLVESKYVSGVDVVSVFNPHIESAQHFAQTNELPGYHDNFDKFCEEIDAVYIASPHLSHYDYAHRALLNGKHVLCEKPMALTQHEAEELYALAHEKNLVLLEAIKTAYTQSFDRLVALAKSGAIGKVKMIEACFTKLETDRTKREFSVDTAGGSMTELGTYGLLPILKILGTDYKDVRFTSYLEDKNGVDLFTSGEILYPNAVGRIKVGLGVKSEGELIISGTTGYIHVPAPWWKTSYFEIKRENTANTGKHFFPFIGEGLRYEITEFCKLIQAGRTESFLWTNNESITAAKLMELYRSGEKTMFIG